MTRLEYSFRPEAVDKLSPWEYGDAVHFSCAWFTAYEDAMAECTFVADCEEALDVVFCGGAGGFGFDGPSNVNGKLPMLSAFLMQNRQQHRRFSSDLLRQLHLAHIIPSKNVIR